MSNIQNDFQEKLNEDNLICSQKDLDNYLLYGVLLESNNNYYDKSGNLINVEIYKPKNFNIDLTSLIYNVNNYIKYNKKDKKIFYMSVQLYEKYKEKKLIINKDGKEYYRLYDNDLWLIYKHSEVD